MRIQRHTAEKTQVRNEAFVWGVTGAYLYVASLNAIGHAPVREKPEHTGDPKKADDFNMGFGKGIPKVFVGQHEYFTQIPDNKVRHNEKQHVVETVKFVRRVVRHDNGRRE